MMSITQEWVDKAEADFATAGRELSVQNQPNNDAVCFHAQQCIEKYLKARLVEANLPSPKIHDLEELLALNLPHEPLWEAFRPMLNDLTSYAVNYRYPGNSATHEMAQTAVANCRLIRQAIRNSLGLSRRA